MTIPRPPLHRLMFLQLGLSIVCGLMAWLHSSVAAYSALLGGLACAVPNAYFIWRAFRYRGARFATRAADALYQAEAWKFLLTALCFAVIFVRIEPLNFIALFVAFMTVQVSHLMAARMINL